MARQLPFTIRLGAVGLYIFGFLLLFLAAEYLGSFFVTLSIVFFLLPLASLSFLLIARSGLRFDQRFDNTSPAKGETVRYWLTLDNQSPFPIPHLRVAFAAAHVGDTKMRGFSTYLPARRTLERSYRVTFPYRAFTRSASSPFN